MTKVVDFGCFVSLPVNNRQEGLVHISNLDYAKVSSAHNFVKRNQKVFVKVMEIKDKKISLSMKDVD